MWSRAQFYGGVGAIAVLAGTICVATVDGTGVEAAGAAAAEPEAVAGALNLRAELRSVSQLGACPPGVSASACAARTGAGPVAGLGSVSEAYTWLADIGPPSCPAGFGKALAYVVRFVVEGKGEIHFNLAEGAQCVDQETVRTQAQMFTVTGGTGIYQAATGSGTVERTLGGETATGRVGRETWTGTLNVPGVEFDLVPPALRGAVAKTVRAPRGTRRVRVTYSVTAGDNADSEVPVSCMPRSGSRFPIGRTTVTCSATDSSGNTTTARFRVTVKVRQ